MLDLAPESARQLSWLAPANSVEQIERKARLMKAMDALNAKYHTQLVWHAAQQPSTIQKNRQHQSAAYTTRWTELPRVKA